MNPEPRPWGASSPAPLRPVWQQSCGEAALLGVRVQGWLPSAPAGDRCPAEGGRERDPSSREPRPWQSAKVEAWRFSASLLSGISFTRASGTSTFSRTRAPGQPTPHHSPVPGGAAPGQPWDWGGAVQGRGGNTSGVRRRARGQRKVGEGPRAGIVGRGGVTGQSFLKIVLVL